MNLFSVLLMLMVIVLIVMNLTDVTLQTRLKIAMILLLFLNHGMIGLELSNWRLNRHYYLDVKHLKIYKKLKKKVVDFFYKLQYTIIVPREGTNKSAQCLFEAGVTPSAVRVTKNS